MCVECIDTDSFVRTIINENDSIWTAIGWWNRLKFLAKILGTHVSSTDSVLNMGCINGFIQN